MDSGSAGNGQERNNKRVLLWRSTRHRDGIWGLAPETWLAISFFLLVMGLSILNAGYCAISDADRDPVMKFGVFILLSAFSVFIWLVQRVESRNHCTRLCIRRHRPKFVGVCGIPPPIQPEFLSAMLLPEVNREWVAAETLPGFEPRHAEMVHPPTRLSTEENGGEESRSKRKRNRKKKTNNDAASAQEPNDSMVQTAQDLVDYMASAQDAINSLVQTAQECIDSVDQVTAIGENEDEGPPRNFSLQTSNEFEEIVKQPTEDCQPNSSNEAIEKSSNLTNQENNEARCSSQDGNPQSFSRLNDNTSDAYKVVEEKPTTNDDISSQSSEDPLQTGNGLVLEESYINSVKTSTNVVSSQDVPENSELTSPSQDQTSVDEYFKELNELSVRLTNKPDTHIPKENGKTSEKTLPSNTTSDGMPQVVTEPLSPEFKTFTSKKRNRRRKK